MRYAFTFDASACTGCKACQVACKDKNDLPIGVLWRRVYEIAGGTWERRGAAWTNTVFAYNMSVACNHCAEPACVAACPTGACAARGDGIVSINADACVGCEYCAWACPYSAPKYSRQLGRTTKCDFCRDLLDQGLSPACVAACPMRALDFRTLIDGAPPEYAGGVALWDVDATAHPYPLPAFSRTEPRVVVRPHAAMGNGLPKDVANREEVRPAAARSARTFGGRHLEDVPLVLFTLLGQAAAGAAVIGLIAGTMNLRLLVTIGTLVALAMASSLLHLGRLSPAWRAPTNAGASPLSREIVALGVFAGAWLFAWIAPAEGRVALGVAGLVLVHAMTDVYAIDGIAGWTRARTRVAFASSALLLGAVAVLTASPVLPLWLTATIATLLLADQFARRWRFYEARHTPVM